jgi:hypothetical protein
MDSAKKEAAWRLPKPAVVLSLFVLTLALIMLPNLVSAQPAPASGTLRTPGLFRRLGVF